MHVGDSLKGVRDRPSKTCRLSVLELWNGHGPGQQESKGRVVETNDVNGAVCHRKKEA